MSDWRVAGETLSKIDLSNRFVEWFNKEMNGVYLFREGPTLSQMDWNASTSVFDPVELDRIWIARVFCKGYELYARRLDYNSNSRWQLRTTANVNCLPSGAPIVFDKEEKTVLWGEATGDGHTFELKPNRFRRARLTYPGTWSAGKRCQLVAARFQPEYGTSIACWQQLEEIA